MIRIGEIAFTNVLPIYHYLETAGLNVELVSQVPSELNQSMKSGLIDVGPISSFAYAENQNLYRLLPNLSVSAYGPVRSIFLFSKTPLLSMLDGSRIALTNTSATSIAMLRILLEKFEQVNPTYFTTTPHLHEMIEHADAALLIGDDALKAIRANNSYYFFDLGEEWYKRTGLGMTFAVWAVQKKLLETMPSELHQIYLRFLAAKDKGIKNIHHIKEIAKRKLGGLDTYWDMYYKGLSYDLGDREWAGLNTFYRYARDLGILSTQLDLSPKFVPCN